MDVGATIGTETRAFGVFQEVESDGSSVSQRYAFSRRYLPVLVKKRQCISIACLAFFFLFAKQNDGTYIPWREHDPIEQDRSGRAEMGQSGPHAKQE